MGVGTAPTENINWSDIKDKLLIPTASLEREFVVECSSILLTLMKENNISQSKVSDLSGVAAGIISGVLQGRSIPKVQTLIKIFGVFGKTLTIADIPEDIQYDSKE